MLLVPLTPTAARALPRIAFGLPGTRLIGRGRTPGSLAVAFPAGWSARTLLAAGLLPLAAAAPLCGEAAS